MSIEHKDFSRTIQGWRQAIRKHPVRSVIYLFIAVLLIMAASFFGKIGGQLTNLFPRDRFHVTLWSSLRYGYPSPLLFVDEHARIVSPIGLAIDVEIVNNRSTMTKIQAHVLDVYIAGSWIRLHTLTVADPLSLYWATESEQDLSKAKRLDFRQSALDVLAQNTSLEPGQSLRGWLFYQWPEALRIPSPGPAFDRMRLTIWNSHGENQSIILEYIEAEGLSAFGRGGKIQIMNEHDLTGFKLVPLME